jgi:hypothetical protein
MRLPNCERAFVDDSKLRYYLDEARRGDPGSKVGLVRDVLGFTDVTSLRAAIVAHAQQHHALRLPDRGHGSQFNVVGPMVGPRGAIVRMVSGWIIQPGARGPRNVTLFPARRQGG